MLKKIFSFEGRIRRSEWYVTILVTSVLLIIPLLNLLAIYVLFAQGAKRCHDVGFSGWWQLVPFSGLYFSFADSEMGPNYWGECPKLNFVQNKNHEE